MEQLINHVVEKEALVLIAILIGFYLYSKLIINVTTDLMIYPYARIFTSQRKRNEKILKSVLNSSVILSIATLYLLEIYGIETIELYTAEGMISTKFINWAGLFFLLWVLVLIIISIPFIDIEPGMKRYKVEYNNVEYIIYDVSPDGNYVLLVEEKSLNNRVKYPIEPIVVSLDDIKGTKIIKIGEGRRKYFSNAAKKVKSLFTRSKKSSTLEGKEMVLIEGDKNNIIITVLQEKDGGYTGISSSISRQVLINKLIEEGILEDGKAVFFVEENELYQKTGE